MILWSRTTKSDNPINPQPKLQNINNQPNNNIVHDDGFGIAYGFAA